jgi:hypothetical protein
MKQIFVVITLIIFIIFIILITVTLLRVPISKGKILKQAKLWVHLFCPPKDLFDLVVDEEIDVTNLNNLQLFKFKLKYIGPYAGGILLEKFSDNLYRNRYELQLRIKLDFYKDNKLLISKKIGNNYSPFYGRKGNGLMLFEFKSPGDIPIDTEITCKSTILVTDEYLSKQYGPMRLYIQKESEE